MIIVMVGIIEVVVVMAITILLNSHLASDVICKDRAVSELDIERPTYGDIDVSVPQDGRHGQEDCQDYQDLHRRLGGEKLWKYFEISYLHLEIGKEMN